MRRLIRALFGLTVALGLVGAVGLTWGYRRYVVEEPGPGFTREEILSIIAQESPVYAMDGETRIGVFFDQEHRSYVPYGELPKAWVDAIVASEDARFFSHPGLDPKHIMRAMRDNVSAGRVVAGGSTLTQQTAKNLFYRPDRSWKAKGEELVNALRLEAHFSKEDILEFYANQFHVSANGRGLGIAARYFFDKEPKALSLKECAFLAGLVKAPATYNPFVGATEERRAAARRAAEDRTTYVLRRMVETGAITRAEQEAALATPLVFRRGSFQYDRSIVVDEVASRLEDPDFLELFARAGIDNPSTAGIRIVTTIDPAIQREATYALVHHLSELGPQLEGPIDPALGERTLMPMAPGLPLDLHEIGVARVVAADAGRSLDLGGRACHLDEAAWTRLEAISGKRTLPVGAFVTASVRDPKAAICDVEVRPELQGAVVVLDQGAVRAMVGGTENRNFNRATAPRQLGSTWKPVIYAAALQLGHLPTDLLDNRPAAFPFRGVWYAPGADHASDAWVTMSEAGARSENIASVWLLAHLTDRLDADAFRRVATLAGVWPESREQPEAWIARLGAEGVTSSVDRFDEYAFTQARQDVLRDLPGSAHPEDAAPLRSLIYGRGAPDLVAAGKLAAWKAEQTWLVMDAKLTACEAEAFVSEPCGAVVPVEPTIDAEGIVLPPPTPDPRIGTLHRSTMVALRDAMARRRALLDGRDPWEKDVLALNPEVRTLVGIRYVQKLAAALGVHETLPTSLTLPLGAADVSLVEMTSVYQGLLDGQRRSFSAVGFLDGGVVGLRERVALPAAELPTALISQVRTAVGDEMDRLDADVTPAADPLSGAMVGDILRGVVRTGTGRRAADAVKIGGVAIPLAGKTGTTNDYRNAAFLGFAPRFADGVAKWGDAYTVGVYVGYDDNRPMKQGKLRVQGANGALPVWLGVVKAMAREGRLGTAAAAEYTWPTETERREGSGVLTVAGGRRRFAPLDDPAIHEAAEAEPVPEAGVVAPTEPTEGTTEDMPADEDTPVRILPLSPPVAEPPPEAPAD